MTQHKNNTEYTVDKRTACCQCCDATAEWDTFIECVQCKIRLCTDCANSHYIKGACPTCWQEGGKNDDAINPLDAKDEMGPDLIAQRDRLQAVNAQLLKVCRYIEEDGAMFNSLTAEVAKMLQAAIAEAEKEVTTDSQTTRQVE